MIASHDPPDSEPETVTEPFVQPEARTVSDRLVMRAVLLGDRLDHRHLERAASDLVDPIQLASPDGRIVFVFRWGAVVFAGATPDQEREMLEKLRPLIGHPHAAPVEEVAKLMIGSPEDGIDSGGVICLVDAAVPRLAIVADVLAKSAALSHQEATLSETLDAMEPVVGSLRARGRLAVSSRSLKRVIGASLLARSHATARVQVDDKPDLLWDHPELGRLQSRLGDEYELHERYLALDRKHTMITESTGTLIALIEARRSWALEAAVVALIALELVAGIYELFFK